ncbi:unnamed protein product [Trichogramma brassicae]|uniref:Uncharacterized protein n=1 Tax=Trichogramma brassicae TaxID=86971 RepID=A0A6H5HZK6_9HYME|nr:unnamed protein product [Trichogramma brassicae]
MTRDCLSRRIVTIVKSTKSLIQMKSYLRKLTKSRFKAKKYFSIAPVALARPRWSSVNRSARPRTSFGSRLPVLDESGSGMPRASLCSTVRDMTLPLRTVLRPRIYIGSASGLI